MFGKFKKGNKNKRGDLMRQQTKVIVHNTSWFSLGQKAKGKPFQFFVIEDMFELRQIVQDAIVMMDGAIAGYAESCDEIIHKLKPVKSIVDVITMDINLGKMNSLSMIPVIKEMAPQAKIVIVSANPTESNVKRALFELNVHHFLVKPFSHEDFCETFAHVLGTNTGYLADVFRATE